MSATTLATSSNSNDSNAKNSSEKIGGPWRDGWSNGDDESSADEKPSSVPIPVTPPPVHSLTGGMPNGGILD